MIIEIEVLEPALYAEYVDKVRPTVEKFGGRYLARGGKVRVLSGDWQPERIILLEFPSHERVEQWLSSPDYAPLRALRNKAARGRAIIVEGIM